MTEHQQWQKRIALVKFANSPSELPRKVRIERAAAYVGASINDVEAWVKGAGL